MYTQPLNSGGIWSSTYLNQYLFLQRIVLALPRRLGGLRKLGGRFPLLRPDLNKKISITLSEK